MMHRCIVSGLLLCKRINCHIFKFVLFPSKRKILPRRPRKKVVLGSSILLVYERSDLFTFSPTDCTLWLKTLSYLAKLKHKSHTCTGLPFYQDIETISVIISKRTQTLWLLMYFKWFHSLFTIETVPRPSKCIILYILKTVSLYALWIRLWWKQTRPSLSPERSLVIKAKQCRNLSETESPSQPQFHFIVSHSL